MMKDNSYHQNTGFYAMLLIITQDSSTYIYHNSLNLVLKATTYNFCATIQSKTNKFNMYSTLNITITFCHWDYG